MSLRYNSATNSWVTVPEGANNGPKTPRNSGFCDAPVEMLVGRHRVTACCDLPWGHKGIHQALLDDAKGEEPKGAA